MLGATVGATAVGQGFVTPAAEGVVGKGLLVAEPAPVTPPGLATVGLVVALQGATVPLCGVPIPPTAVFTPGATWPGELP
jgi:hypothetical protein